MKKSDKEKKPVRFNDSHNTIIYSNKSKKELTEIYKLGIEKLAISEDKETLLIIADND